MSAAMQGLDQKAACPYFATHGNPFRYCVCGWMEEQSEPAPEKPIGERLRDERLRRRLSYREAAEQLGTSAANLHKVENGSDPRWSFVQRALAWLKGGAA